ncbi:DNRLRE domain-containing protein [Paenibacillus beijingensis]|uniref:Fibronectin type-III domain-containing protein n=1 Tax=Paenibacillus beijingensis TaxID=1126833 RepID=A0A0D5NEP2_9BACL|nr:DNRLRE domain-containing protein [Paenibacillus beijingensis]AJY73854.1 hypothetical protein VN24_03535 [Paenibacillus beijingensis]
MKRKLAFLLLFCFVFQSLSLTVVQARNISDSMKNSVTYKEEDEVVSETVYGNDPQTSKRVAEVTYNRYPVGVLDKAKKLGKTVVREDVERRTANSKHYQLSDGSFIADITMGPQNFLDNTGNWQPINTELIDEADLDMVNIPFSQVSSDVLKKIVLKNKEIRKNIKIDRTKTSYRAPQVPFDVKIPKKFDSGYSIGKGSEKLTFTPIKANTVTAVVYSKAENQNDRDNANTVTADVYSNKAEYHNAWDNTDVQLEVLDIGIKETIILKNNQAPTTFRFHVAGDIKNSKNFELQPAWLVDANGTKRDVSQIIDEADGETFIQLDVDTTDLQFPIYVDPSVITTSTSKDMTCNDYWHSCYDGSSDSFSVGSWSGYYDSSYNSYEGFFQFDLTSIPINSVINNASMELYIFSGYTDNSHTGNVYRVTSAWDETTTQVPSYDSTNSVPTVTGYLGTVLNSVNKPGWWVTNITSIVQQWANGTPNYGVMVRTGALQSAKIIRTHEYTDSAYRPKLTVTYNSPPIVSPTVLSPNGGETIDSTFNIVWNGAVDPDNTQTSLNYHIQLSTNGGGNWIDLVSQTGAGVTQYQYNFSSVSDSTNALIRIRAYDGSLYGPWDQSDAPFTIKHNKAPNAPTSLNPGSTSSSTPTRVVTNPVLKWTFSDPDAGDAQSAYQVQIFNGSTLVKDSGWVTTSLSSYSVPSSLLARNTTYNWKVRTKDKKGAISGYSAAYYIKINNLPIASITSYTDGQQLTDNVLSFTWTYSDTDGQAESNYQILGSQNNWASIGYDSGVKSGSATSFTTPPLASGTWSFKILVKDGIEWSNAAYRNNLKLPNAFEPNDSNTQAFPINYNQTYSSLINSGTDVDFFKYTAPTTGIDKLVLNVPSGLNYDVYIYDSAMALITAGVHGAGLQEKEIFDVTSGRTYYIKIVGVGGNYSTSLAYNFSLSSVTLQFQTTYQYDSNGNIISKTTTIVR